VGKVQRLMERMPLRREIVIKLISKEWDINWQTNLDGPFDCIKCERKRPIKFPGGSNNVVAFLRFVFKLKEHLVELFKATLQLRYILIIEIVLE
jgi:hypothetical protein